MPDKFDEYLRDEDQPTRLRALTSRSYKNFFQRENGSSLPEENINVELATYGDALLKLAFCKILFDEGVPNITVEKQEYETDKVLVEIIARHYELLKYLHFDESDNNIPRDYEYKGPSDTPHKYIATAVEALIAALYLDNNEDFSVVVEIAKHWKEMIDSAP